MLPHTPRRSQTTLILLLLAPFSACTASAQQATQQPAQREQLSLTLLPRNVVEGVPQSFTFQLTNRSGEDLRLPPPDVDCSNPTPRGSLRLEEAWTPPTGDGLAKGSSSCDFGGAYPSSQNPITESAQSWFVLRPGESRNFVFTLADMHVVSTQSGTYIFSGSYTPPHLTSEEQRALQNQGINYPRQQVTTPRLAYRKP